MKPTTLPEDLSERALALYLDMLDIQRSGRRPDGEALDVEAAREIDAANLGNFWEGSEPRYNGLSVYRLHREFIEHTGLATKDPTWELEVSVVDAEMPDYAPHRYLLLRADRCAIQKMDSRAGMERHRILVRHPHDTDFEHDAMILASLQVVGLKADYYGHQAISHYGIVTEARLWQRSDDPYAQHQGGDPVGGTCENKTCTPHRFGNYLPPERAGTDDLKGEMIEVTLRLPGGE